MRVPRTYWDDFAPACGELGPPLRPSPEDLRFAEQTVAQMTAPRVLMLGVTPRIADLRWPEGSRIVALDKSHSMTRTAWPGNLEGRRWVACANWLTPPLGRDSCDVVIGDGSINNIEFPGEFERLTCVAASVLCESGRMILRCYLQSDPAESVDAVFDAALAGQIGSFHTFKLRLLMAMQPSACAGVCVGDVYRTWAHWGRRSLPGGPGWGPAAVATIEYYRDSTTRYAFPTKEELKGALFPRFELESYFQPSYEFGERCPTLVLRPRRTA